MSSNTSKFLIRIFAVLSMLLALLATYLVYQPGLTGTFIFDDGPNILNNTNLAISDLHVDTLKRAAFSIPNGPFRRPISMLSFAGNIYATGLNPYFFKLTNLLIHMVNGLGIFVLSLQLLGIYRTRFQPALTAWHIQTASLAIAAAWLLHPLNLTSVLYIVQRMTSLSALFSIWGLILFVWGRMRLFEGKTGIAATLASLLLFMPLAILSKENGALMPALMFAIEITLFNFQANKPTARRFLQVFYAITFVVPAIITIVYIATHFAGLIASYQGRSFTFTERVLTEARVLWFYVGQIIFPSIAKMGMYHDDIAISQGLLAPVTTLPSIIGIIALIASAWVVRKKAPLLSFGIAFFLIGHALESTIYPLELVHEHRNYLPMYGILLAMFFYALYPLAYLPNLKIRRLVVVLLIALFGYGTWARSTEWANPFDLAKSEVEHHPNSARANAEMGSNYASITTQDAGITELYYQKAMYYYQQTAVVDPDYTNGLFSMIIYSSLKGKTVDPHWITELAHRLQFSPAEPGIGNKFTQLFICEDQKKCTLDRRDIEKLVNAALANPTVISGKRAAVFSSYAYYLINVASDYPAALDAMQKAADSSPQELSYRMGLVEFLTALKHSEEAKKQLAVLKSMDTLGMYTAQIAEQEKTLITSPQQH